MRPPLPSHWRVSVVVGMYARAIGADEELGANRGVLPDYVSRRCKTPLGLYYCCLAVAATYADVLGLASPIILSGSCMQQRQRAKKLGALRTRAEFDAMRTAHPESVAGWILLVIDPAAKDADGPDLPGHAHHAGLVGDIDDRAGTLVVNGPRGGFLTIEANAADPAKPASRNGDGWYHGRERGHPDDHTTYEFIDPSAFPP